MVAYLAIFLLEPAVSFSAEEEQVQGVLQNLYAGDSFEVLVLDLQISLKSLS